VGNDRVILRDFLNAAAARPTVWGVWDCHLWLADWVLACRGGEDPAAALRGRYRTPLGARRLLKRAGGSEAVVESAGLERLSAPEPGCIGLLPVSGGGGFDLIGGLYTGQRWAVLGYPAGVVAHPFTASHVWRV
jgi:hypothetical protein